MPKVITPAASSRFTMNASLGALPASAHEPAVVGMPVVLMLSLAMIAIPSSGRGLSRSANRLHRSRASLKHAALNGGINTHVNVRFSTISTSRSSSGTPSGLR